MTDLHLLIVGDSRQVEFLVPGDQFLVVELKARLLFGRQGQPQGLRSVN